MQFKQKILAVFLVLYLSCSSIAYATTFTVTNNNNAGIGSLREAITSANSNGTTNADYIYFNINATLSANVTINLTEELPTLTSNIILDASTQPGGLLGSTAIKIRLLNASATFISGFILKDVDHIEIYGFDFVNFNADQLAGIAALKGAIYLKNASDIIIGKPFRGNSFGNNYAGIFAPLETHITENVKIQSNYFGLLPDGVGQMANRNGIDISYIKNSFIGGISADLGNIFGPNETSGLSVGGMSGTMLIANNRVGFDAAQKFIPTNTATGIYANGVNCTLTITDNVVAGQRKGFFINDVDKGFSIQRNRVGTGLAGTENYANVEVGIEIFQCDIGTIGSTNNNDKNYIAYNRDGILINNSYPITITKNSLYCNSRYPISFQNVDINKVRTPQIALITTNSVSGTYLPNATIELFYDDDCAGCEGKTYVGSVPTKADGSWEYLGAITGAITITGTNIDQATSAFSSPILNDLALQITNEFCGSSNGSIKNIQVSDATVYRWYNSNNAQVGNARDLMNVKAGKYYLIAGQNGGCEVVTPVYEIKNTDITYKVKTAVINSSACGKTNGSVQVVSYETDVPKTFTWLDATDKIVSTDANLSNALPGIYRLFGDNGLGCKNLAGTFTIEAITDLVINTTKMTIVNTDCLKDEGSILSISISGGTMPFIYQWFDANNQVVGSKLAIEKVPSGNYYLKIIDAKDCTVQSDVFSIPPSPLNAKLADTFSPNGDGINDTWRVPGIAGFSSTEIKIFNRQGNLVFLSKNGERDFDGRYNGKDLPVGVYYYFIDLKNDCKSINGSITLIR